MFHVFSLFVLAFAVSLDGFGVGVTYGLRKIRFPLWSLLIVTVCSATMILLAMQVGGALTNAVSPQFAKALGAFILIGVGSFAIYNLVTQKEKEPVEENGDSADSSRDGQTLAKKTTVLRLELKKLGLVIQILRTPSSADVDRSGDISIKEALVLGFALSMDGFGAGIGASLVGFHSVSTALTIAGMNLLFIYSGMRIGIRYADARFLQRMAFLPGMMLILIGISKFF
ncbi:sporulation membrane protein YtaF [Tumebacillus permanentifrigoris]|uniref:Putative sporulation protein YtaF n=1 Tax=Tumebacillus permanentifrigoris TaxID=378543 RepID=A0A316DE02_9BACL|nr:sporulation membrane protein YtaF [Tumebacillus permanentifrigoris]PWK13887.1 putative sporulation protein YtaF [Tumebacillus permanentifrigoris]